MSTIELLQFLAVAAIMVIALKAWGRLDEAAWRRQRERAERAGQQAQ